MTPSQPLKTAPEWESSSGAAPTPKRAMSRADYMRDYRRALQRRTAIRADRALARWTPAEDRILTQGKGTVLERAVRLGRTYHACVRRLAVLHGQQEATG